MGMLKVRRGNWKSLGLLSKCLHLSRERSRLSFSSDESSDVGVVDAGMARGRKRKERHAKPRLTEESSHNDFKS